MVHTVVHVMVQIWAAGNMRAKDGCTPLECLDLLVILLRENDNCENSLSDDYYVAQVTLSYLVHIRRFV